MNINFIDTIKKYFSLNIYTGILLLTVYYIIQAGWINFTFAADDYYYLSKNTSANGLSVSDDFLVDIFARIPLHAVLQWVVFQFPFRESSLNYYFYFLFILNSIILRFLLIYVFNELEESKFISCSKFNISWLIVSCYPCNYEIMFWLTASSYIYGAVFLVMGLRSKGLLRVLLFYLSFLFSEMYILPIIVFIYVKDLRNGNYTMFKEIKNKYLLYIIAVILIIITKIILGLYVSSGNKTFFNTEFYEILRNIPDWISNTYSIHFYKIYPITALWIITYVYIQYKLIKKNDLSMIVICKINLAILFPFSISLFMAGPSIRAMYGATLFMLAMIGWILYIWQKNSKNMIPLVMILLIFATHQAYIFNIKNFNYEVVIQKKSNLIDYFQKCEEPCTVNLNDISSGFKRDYIMPIYYSREFVEWVRNNNHINKEVRYIL